jgi:solute carrier family 25 (mitochondrial citrate transporter), member 1
VHGALATLSAGCIAGGIEATAVWPLEYIKTQLQLQKVGQPAPFHGMVSGLTYTVRTSGFFSLYRGLGVTLLGSVPKAGIRFSGNAQIKAMFLQCNGGKRLNMLQQFLAGMGAGAVEAVLAVTPMETVKTKLIETNQGLIPGVKSILKESGIRGMYQGVVATVMKQGSNQGLRFMWFNKYKDLMTNNGETQLGVFYSLLGGMSAGCFSTLGNNPVDVVKTRMQGIRATEYKNTWDCFSKIWQREGMRGFYSGVLPRLGRVIPGQGIIFMSFETIKDVLAEKVFKT